MSTLKVNSIEGATGGEVDINATLGSIPSLVITGVTTVSAGTTSAPAITPSGDSNTGIFFPSADTIAFAEGGVEAARFDSSGRLGIGTTNPTQKLQVYDGSLNVYKPTGEVQVQVESGDTSVAVFRAISPYRNWRFGIQGGANADFVIRDTTSSANRLGITSAGEVIIGSNATPLVPTGTASQPLQVTGGAYVSGSVGIGTTIPTAKLEPVDTAANPSVAPVVFIQRPNNVAPASIAPTNADLRIKSHSSNFKIYAEDHSANPLMILTGSGNVGLGTTNPFSKLEMRYASSTAYSSTASPQTSNSLTIFNTDTTSTTTFSGIALGNRRNGNGAFVGIECVGTANDATALAFKTQSAGPVFAEVARFDSSGRLLIGTTTARGDFFNTSNRGPGFQVEGTTTNTSGVSVTANLNNDNGAELNFGKSRGTNTGSSTIVAANDTLGRISFQGADGLELVAAAYIQADVDGTPGANDMPGRLVFATTADGASSPTERFRIANSGRGSYFSSSSSGFGIACSPGASNTDNIFEGLHSATAVNTGTLSFLVRTNGNVLNTNSSYGALSDVKLKENIVDAASQWDDIKALRVRKYNFKEGQTHTQIGVIAQEVEQVAPGLVTESPDRDAEGNDLGTTTKAVQYSVLYMKAVKALQEAQVRIEQLESKVAALEAK